MYVQRKLREMYVAFPESFKVGQYVFVYKHKLEVVLQTTTNDCHVNSLKRDTSMLSQELVT